MNNGKQPITPSMWAKFGDGADDYKPTRDDAKNGYEIKFGGLSKREHFAGLAMQGILANRELQLALYKDTAMYVKEYPHMNPENCLAIHAVRQADNLLAELEKSK